MQITEYEKIKNMSYAKYCDYLQNKYGISSYNYMTERWEKNPKCSRTMEGLVAHHKYEDHAIRLSKKEYAMKHPFEWQLAKNIIFCDLLEHLFLHILICEEAIKSNTQHKLLGIRGILCYMIPELNDVYGGWKSQKQWEINCHNQIINDKNVYLTLIKRMRKSCRNYPLYSDSKLYTSLNEKFGNWTKHQNEQLYSEMSIL